MKQTEKCILCSNLYPNYESENNRLNNYMS